MKLAEALLLRADCQKRIAQLEQRFIRSARVQEGEQPAENPHSLMAELETATAELTGLIQRINRTNTAIEFDGKTLADALAERDVLQTKRKVYSTLMNAAAISQDRYMRTELRYVSTVNVAELQALIDRLARDYRELDARIQATNWLTDLNED
jgi:hypothetical protein